MNIETQLQQEQLEQVERISYCPDILLYEHGKPITGSMVVLRLPIQSPDF